VVVAGRTRAGTLAGSCRHRERTGQAAAGAAAAQARGSTAQTAL